jgi:isocitrate dehydrogenase
MTEPSLTPPAGGAKITIANGKLTVPNNPIVPFIEGDGTGRDIWRASVRVFDAVVEKVYKGQRKIHWMEVYAGEKSFKQFNSWLPDSTVTACRDYLVSIKGPLTTPIGGGIRSLNVALRQMLDLYVCLRPVRWFKGVPSPVKAPEKVEMVIFRENCEDIYAGIEFEQGGEANKKFLDLFKANFPKEYAKIRFPETSGIGIKAVSKDGTERLIRSAIEYAIANKRKSVTIVHKGNIMKFTEGAFRNWGYALAEGEFGDKVSRGNSGRRPRLPAASRGERRAKPHWRAAGSDQGRDRRHHAAAGADAAGRIRRDRHAESHGDYLSDALAAQVSGIGIAPDDIASDRVMRVRGDAWPAEVRRPGKGRSRFSDPVRRDDAALHWAGQTRALIAMDTAIGNRDLRFARLMEGAKGVKCSIRDELIKGDLIASQKRRLNHEHRRTR